MKSAWLVTALLLVQTVAAAAQAAGGIQFDTIRLTPEIRTMIQSDFNALDQLQFDGQIDNLFRLYFRGTSTRDVENYLVDRVRYAGVDLDRKGKLEAGTYAVNFGPDFLSYYYHSVVLHERNAKPEMVAFDQTKIAMISPRVGYIGIGAAYVDPNTSMIDRLDTWIHEARHSDCPHIPSVQDLAYLDKDQESRVTMDGLTCGNSHVRCPSGPLKGQLACDAHAWGAYSAGYIFSENVHRACSNCTEQQKQDALASASDDLTRLTPQLRAFYKQSNPTPPDMSSFDEHNFHP